MVGVCFPFLCMPSTNCAVHPFLGLITVDWQRNREDFAPTMGTLSALPSHIYRDLSPSCSANNIIIFEYVFALVGRWSSESYGRSLYPGLITSFFKVKVFIFCWPISMFQRRISAVLSLISHISSRRLVIKPALWRSTDKLLVVFSCFVWCPFVPGTLYACRWLTCPSSDFYVPTCLPCPIRVHKLVFLRKCTPAVNYSLLPHKRRCSRRDMSKLYDKMLTDMILRQRECSWMKFIFVDRHNSSYELKNSHNAKLLIKKMVDYPNDPPVSCTACQPLSRKSSTH